MTTEEIKTFFNRVNDEGVPEETPLVMVMGEGDQYHTIIFGEEEECCEMALGILVAIFDDMNDGATIQEYADSVRDSIIAFSLAQSTEE